MSFLTLYRPNFCAECGDKIVRLRWRVWTNRKLCDKCFPRFRNTHLLQRLLTAATLLMLGIGFGRACKTEKPPLVIQRTASQPQAPLNQTPPPAVIEQTYTCGARTKKGTPCSRRVHGPVRCWQHKGAAAMLPNEKLIVKE